MRNGYDFGDIIDEIIEHALGENSVASDVDSARRSIFFVLNDWHARQFNTWRVRSLDLAFIGGFAKIQLPLDLDDVLVVNALSADGKETPMVRLSETQWAMLTTKNTAGQPTQFVLHRTEPAVIEFTPAGFSGATQGVRITYIQRPADFDRYSTDVDLPARWHNALITNAALHLALKRPERANKRITGLTQLATSSLTLALGDDRQRVSFKMRIG